MKEVKEGVSHCAINKHLKDVSGINAMSMSTQHCSLVLVRAVTLMSVSYHALRIETKKCARDVKGCLNLIGVVHLQCCVSVCMYLCV